MLGRKLRLRISALATAAITCGLLESAWAARIEEDPVPSRRTPDLLVSLFPSELLADAEPETQFPKLWPVRFFSMQYAESAELKLYDAHGALDLFTLAALDHLLGDGRDATDRRETTIDRRVLQLIFKAAYHFDSHHVTVVSGYRDPGRSSEGRHGEGKAVDFRLQGVTAQKLAAYLRTQARVGVGVYTHPRTQFVHLDNRDTSFHWLDASPPGRRWRERSLGRTGIAARDRSYRCEDDWPEGPLPPSGRECAQGRSRFDPADIEGKERSLSQAMLGSSGPAESQETRDSSLRSVDNSLGPALVPSAWGEPLTPALTPSAWGEQLTPAFVPTEP